MQADILVINKIDLAPYVGASLEVMESDTKVVRGNRPYVMTNCKTGEGVVELVDMIMDKFLFTHQIPSESMTQLRAEIAGTPTRLRAHLLGEKAPEMAPYQDEPKQMQSGAIGKSGYLKLRFAKREYRSEMVEMERRVPSLVQRALYWDEMMPQMPCVTMISTSGCLLQGDRQALDLIVEEGACAHVTTQSATKIHMMEANYATQYQNVVVEAGGYLEFMPDPIIPHRNARFLTDTQITVDPTATVIYSEILMSGRKYHHPDEQFGFDIFSSKIRAQDNEGKELFVEKYILEPKKEALNVVGVMGVLMFSVT